MTSSGTTFLVCGHLQRNTCSDSRLTGLCQSCGITDMSILKVTPQSPCLVLQEQQIGVEEYEALCKGTRNLTPPPITDELSRWVNETQWSALQPLTQLPVSTKLLIS